MKSGQRTESPRSDHCRILLVAAVISLSLVLSGCAAAVEESLVEGALIRGLPAGAASAGLAEGAAMGPGLGAADAIGARTLIGTGEDVAMARMGVAEGSTAGIAARRAAGAAVLTEARIAAIASRSGLSGVLEEMSYTKPIIDSFGRISVRGHTVLTAAGDSFIRLPSGGVLGQIRDAKIFAVDSFGKPGIAIGELSVTREIGSQLPLEVIRLRDDWYNVVIGGETTAATADVAIIPLGGGKDNDQKTRDEEALKAEARRLRDKIDGFLAKE